MTDFDPKAEETAIRAVLNDYFDGLYHGRIDQFASAFHPEARLFTDYAPETGATEVPDAYYTQDYSGALDLIEICAERLVAALAAR